MSKSVKNGIIWVGLSVPQGDKGGEVNKQIEALDKILGSGLYYK